MRSPDACCGRSRGKRVNVRGRAMRTIWLGADGRTVEIIDQTRLPHELVITKLQTVADAARAISTMQVRGAPLIGVAAAYGVALAIAEDPSDEGLAAAAAELGQTRPTAVNLRWALAEMKSALQAVPEERRFAAAVARAGAIDEADVAISRAIGEHGVTPIAQARPRQGRQAQRVKSVSPRNGGWPAA